MITPFIYIGGIMRSGTTLIQEMLTDIPRAFIFHEPWFALGSFTNKDVSLNQLDEHGIDIRQIITEAHNPCEFLDKMSDLYSMQVGVKEVRNVNCLFYPRHIKPDDIKAVFIGRDPRDVYVSVQKFRQRGFLADPVMFSPQSLYVIVHEEIANLTALSEEVESIKVRYEDICNDWTVMDQVRDFCGWKGNNNSFGETHKYIDRGDYELKKHSSGITNKSVGQWQWSGAKDRAEFFYDLMAEYRDFFGYE